MELLWLLIVVLVPLAFLDRQYSVSETVIAYVEVPKIALLRTLTGLMAILWVLEWGITFRISTAATFAERVQRLRIRRIGTAMLGWLRDQPVRWLILAVWFFLVTTLLGTIFSASFSVSLWGDVPGQDGYSTYTVVAYVVLFGVIATHLKTGPQLWRLLGAIVIMGYVLRLRRDA